MADVARRAGVSQSTVSFVVNDRVDARIPEETRARVLSVIQELGFRPNLVARGLRLRQTKTIGFVTDQIVSSPYAGRTVLGAQNYAWQKGCLLLVVNTAGAPDLESAAVDAFLDRQVDSLIYAAMSLRAVTPPQDFSNVPSILVNCFSNKDSDKFPSIIPLEYEGGKLAAQAVIDAGHDKIGFLGGTATDLATQKRTKAFLDCMRAAGITVNPRWIRQNGDYTIKSGYQFARSMCHEPLPTALICGNDRMAAGAMIALLESGVRIPADVSIVGYDDQADLATDLHPALTTVTLPHYEMGWCAAAALLEPLPENGAIKSQTVAGRLVERDSLAPPRTG